MFLFLVFFILCVLALDIPRSMCSCFGLPCSMNSYFRHSLLCALVLGVPHFVLLLWVFFDLCVLVLGIFHFVFLLLVFFVVLRTTSGSC